MLLKFKFFKKDVFFKIIIITSFFNALLTVPSIRKNSAIFAEENFLKLNLKNIEWEKLEINNGNYDQPNLIWENYDESKLNDDSQDVFNKKNKRIESTKFKYFDSSRKNLSSLNRSIVFPNRKIGPDISFLVPVGFKSISENFLDISIRGWNRRPKNSNLFQWNGGDAVGQMFYNFFYNEKSSLGVSLGVRSLYKGDLEGGTTSFGEGLSSGFRWDYKLGDLMGLAIGAEQLFQFDDKTDTGRDIYVAISKAFLNTKTDKLFPFLVLTGGVGTGYFALWDKTKFGCTDLFDGAAVDLHKYHRLCWGPFGTFSWVLNEKLSTFFEYNNYSFMLGASVVPLERLRFTAGATIAESFDDYKIKNLDEIRLFGRFSFAF